MKKLILILFFILFLPSIASAPIWPIKTRASQVRTKISSFGVNISTSATSSQKVFDELNTVVISSATYSVTSGTATYSSNSDKLDGYHWSEISSVIVDTATYSVTSGSATYAPGDDLGNHTATQDINASAYNLSITTVTLGGNLAKIGDNFYIYLTSAGADSIVYIENPDATGVANLYVEGDISVQDITQVMVYSTHTVTDYLTVNSTSSFGGTATFVGINASGQVTSNARKLIDQYDYAVCITTPNALSTIATLISPFRSYAVTISTISAQIIGGTNVVFMIEQRTIAGIESAGTDIWSGDITAVVTNWTGGGVNDFTVPVDSALVLVPTSVSGAVDRLMIKYRLTKD